MSDWAIIHAGASAQVGTSKQGLNGEASDLPGNCVITGQIGFWGLTSLYRLSLLSCGFHENVREEAKSFTLIK